MLQNKKHDKHINNKPKHYEPFDAFLQKKIVPVRLCKDCSISQQAMTASIA
jgi:hypothetical protein